MFPSIKLRADTNDRSPILLTKNKLYLSSGDLENIHRVVAEAYDTIAPRYHSLFALNPTATRTRYTQQLVDALGPDSAVLELGCGGGPGTQPFVARGCRITGVDISAAQIALARTHLPNATLVHGDMRTVSLPPASFDAVVAMYSIVHLRKEDQEAMVTKIAGWLKGGGYLLCNLAGGEASTSTGKWLGADTFFESLGVEGNRKMLMEYGEGLQVIRDEVIVDKYDPVAADAIGATDETFHWIFAVKRDISE
ncbi:hypothetical protein HYPSUDRAFT_220399 [Hypholoma sublateritium FD-334 SS-4]|uniref:Methyltransferase domain-containing protein n=1 Tax=Hypholoma sublateritium (strain FD-334 SS-4) TaxID=945553 RepID=A0A0D2P1Y1_HYPSF|nr:hypothetical protein HYPSUDRAFT_220399 [Hypholoma sublateritium FD-334 SS-4]